MKLICSPPPLPQKSVKIIGGFSLILGRQEMERLYYMVLGREATVVLGREATVVLGREATMVLGREATMERLPWF